MKTLGDALCVVKTRACGCFVSLSSAKDQGAGHRVGERYEHPDKSVSTLMTLKMAAGVPQACAEHAARDAQAAAKVEA
jgi:hypothetical protein